MKYMMIQLIWLLQFILTLTFSTTTNHNTKTLDENILSHQTQTIYKSTPPTLDHTISKCIYKYIKVNVGIVS